jgi:hypothetical protein
MIRPSQFATSFLFSAIGLATFVTSSGVAAPDHVYFLKDFKTIPHHLCMATRAQYTRINIPISFRASPPPLSAIRNCGSGCDPMDDDNPCAADCRNCAQTKPGLGDFRCQ